MATGEKWTAQAVATTFDSGDIMSIVQSGDNKQVDHDVLMDDTQICKAWVNFNGTGTVAIRDDFNVSSITDNGTADYNINFTNALDDANYIIIGNQSAQNGVRPTQGVMINTIKATTVEEAPTVNGFRIALEATIVGDVKYVSVAAFGS